MSEACRIVILKTPQGVVDVGAPMKHKDLCYDILNDAAIVISRTPDHMFQIGTQKIVIVMSQKGTVDVGAPLPPRAICEQWLKTARDIIERFNDDSAPAMRAFSRELVEG